MKYVDISSYKAWLRTEHMVMTPFKGRFYQVTNPATNRPEVTLHKNGLLVLHVGMFHDWASGPTWDDKTNRDPCAEHDGLFRILRTCDDVHFTWQEADDFMVQRLKECGMGWIRRTAWKWGRRLPFLARGKQARKAVEPCHILLDSNND